VIPQAPVLDSIAAASIVQAFVNDAADRFSIRNRLYRWTINGGWSERF